MKKTLFLALILNFSISQFVISVSAQRQISSERIEVTKRLDAHPDQAAMAVLAKYKPAVDSLIAPVLGESLMGMSGGRPESLLSNWTADVLVAISDFTDGKKADMGLCNMGGLRNNMPKGVVRRGDIMLISPFNNHLAVAHLKGSDLLELMRNIAAVRGEGVSREVRLVITKDGSLESATLNGEPIDPERTYRVATNDYLTDGNDKMFALKKALKVDVSEAIVRECMMKYIEQHSPISAAIEGRIVVKD